ncbi:TPA: adenylosuccinate lyase [Candidatus Bathyarchaeota archaeon]|nr:adenylosuccinate lyase [Candidatus Bathyarchaeota archaeon]
MKMSVHPIEYRYFYPRMKSVFEEENRLQMWLEVEAALARAHSVVGYIPKEAAEEITRKAHTRYVPLKRVKEIERSVRHDVMAMVLALSEACDGDAGKYVHLGATSADIVDTARALQLKEALAIIHADLRALRDVLVDLADRYKALVAVGRTHGIQASPITYGLKFAVWAMDTDRHIRRLKECEPRLLVGKIMGPTGTQAALGSAAMRIQEIVMRDLGLNEPLVVTQIVPREEYAEFLCILALIASTLEKIGTEIRNLQRTEIGEVEEFFEAREQIGSSAMPGKRNPIISERVCGLARVIRAYASVALQNIPVWHERDLTQSSTERIIIPSSCILIDYMLKRMAEVLRNLRIHPEKVERNLRLTHGLFMSEAVMMKLIEKGLGRQEAHRVVWRCAMDAIEGGRAYAERRTPHWKLGVKADWPGE